MESLLPSSVCSVIRISRVKVGQSNYEEWRTLTPSVVRVGNNKVCLDNVSTKDGSNFVPQLCGFLIGLGIHLALVLKSICAHLLAEG